MKATNAWGSQSPEASRMGAYVRISSANPEDAQTIEGQITRLQAYFQEVGEPWSEANLYRDDGVSGATWNRPGLDRLRDRVARRELDRVIVTAPDRLARNYVQQVLLIEEFMAAGCQVEFLDRPMTDSPHDQLVLQIRGAVAEYERALITDRMRRGRRRKYEAGVLLPWTDPPYGYRLDPQEPRNPKKVRLDAGEAAIVAQVFTEYLEPKATLCSVAKGLVKAGAKTRKGGLWNPSTVSSMLRNPAYTGVVYAGRGRSRPVRQRLSAMRPVGKAPTVQEPTPQAAWIRVAEIPRIVTDEQFDRVQEKLSHNQSFAMRNNKRHDYLLRALVSCGSCLSACLGRTTHDGNYSYYVCSKEHLPRCVGAKMTVEQRCASRFIPADQLDALVWQDVCELLTHPETIQEALVRAQGGHLGPQELQARQEGLRRAHRKVEAQIERLMEAYLDGVVGLEELGRRRQELEARLASTKAQAKQLESSRQAAGDLAATVQTVKEFCERVQATLAEATFEQRRQLVELLVDRVVVTGDEVEIRYAVPLSPASEHVRFCHLHMDYRDKANAVVALMNLATGHFALGDFGRSRAYLEECLDLWRGSGLTQAIYACLIELLAGLLVEEGQAERAARLIGVAAALREATSYAVEPGDRAMHERIVGTVRSALGLEAFERAKAEGCAMTPDEALSDALAPEG